MKIALITRDYNSRGGVEKISQYYARVLRDLGHVVVVWCAEYEVDKLDRGLIFERIGACRWLALLKLIVFPLLVWSRVRADDYDAVIVMGTAGICSNSYIVANSVHRVWFGTSLAATEKFSKRWWLKICNVRHYFVMMIEHIQYRCLPFAKVIAVSEPIAQELTSTYGIKPADILLLPNGADFEQLLPDLSIRQETRSRLGIKEHETVFCMLANEFARKGVPQTLDAIKKLDHLPLKLLVVGRLDRRQCLSYAQQLNIQSKLIVQGSTSDVREYLWASDLYILPTQYEAWNLSIMEAHAAGLPVITTRLGQADRVVDNGRSGILLADPLNVEEICTAIETWYQRDDKQLMSRIARYRAQEYSWRNIVVRLERIIHEHSGLSGDQSVVALPNQTIPR